MDSVSATRFTKEHANREDIEHATDRDEFLSAGPAVLAFQKTKRSRDSIIMVYRIIVGSLLLVIVILLSPVVTRSTPDREKSESKNVTEKIEDKEEFVGKALVVASHYSSNLTWLADVGSDWQVHKYVLDSSNPQDPLTLPRFQGRKAMAYLTYIITHYASLPSVMVFVHGHARGWHQPEPLYYKLKALNNTSLAIDGFVNLRCDLMPGCAPGNEIDVSTTTPPSIREDWRPVTRILPGFWRTVCIDTNDGTPLWNMGPPASVLAAPCCAQFAVTKDAVLARPLEFYEMYRKPLMRDMGEFPQFGSEANNYTIGVAYEKLWHVVFGKNAVHCPPEDYCRKVSFSNAIDCDRYTGSWGPGWENITCSLTL